MFNASTGRDLDSMNQFQDLRGMLRKKAELLCRGTTRGATQRREDMANILIEAAKILRTEAKLHEVSVSKLQESAK